MSTARDGDGREEHLSTSGLVCKLSDTFSDRMSVNYAKTRLQSHSCQNKYWVTHCTMAELSELVKFVTLSSCRRGYCIKRCITMLTLNSADIWKWIAAIANDVIGHLCGNSQLEILFATRTTVRRVIKLLCSIWSNSRITFLKIHCRLKWKVQSRKLRSVVACWTAKVCSTCYPLCDPIRK